MKSRLLFAQLLILSVPAVAQPFINYRGVVNAASFEGQGLPAGSIAQGSIFTIFGSNLGPAQYVQSGSFPLPAQLGGVSVSVAQGSTTLAAIPIFVLASQVSAIMPSNAPLGQVVVRVSYNNQTSNPATVNVVAVSRGGFHFPVRGLGRGSCKTSSRPRINRSTLRRRQRSRGRPRFFGARDWEGFLTAITSRRRRAICRRKLACTSAISLQRWPTRVDRHVAPDWIRLYSQCR